MFRLCASLRSAAVGSSSAAVQSNATTATATSRRLTLASAVTIAKRSSVVLNSTLNARPTLEELTAKHRKSTCNNNTPMNTATQVSAAGAAAAAPSGSASSSSSSPHFAANAEAMAQLKAMLIDDYTVGRYAPEGYNVAAAGEQVSRCTVSGTVQWIKVLRTESSPMLDDAVAAAPSSSSSSSAGASSSSVLDAIAAAEKAFPALAGIEEASLPASLHRAASVLQFAISFDTDYTAMTEVKQPNGSIQRAPTNGGAPLSEQGFMVVMAPLSCSPTEAAGRYLTGGGRMPFLSVGSNVLVNGRYRTASSSAWGNGASTTTMLPTMAFVQISADGVESSVRQLPKARAQ